MTDEGASETTDPAAPEPIDSGSFVVIAVLFEAGLAPLALGFAWIFGLPLLDQLTWSIRDTFLGLVATLPMYAAFQVMMRLRIEPLERIRRILARTMLPMLGSRPLSDLALISIAAGVGEELLFRGVFQGLLAHWLGTWQGLAVASFLFGLFHPITPAYVVIAGLLGAYLGTVWVLTGNLLVVILAHAIYDFLALRALTRSLAPDDAEGDSPAST